MQMPCKRHAKGSCAFGQDLQIAAFGASSRGDSVKEECLAAGRRVGERGVCQEGLRASEVARAKMRRLPEEKAPENTISHRFQSFFNGFQGISAPTQRPSSGPRPARLCVRRLLVWSACSAQSLTEHSSKASAGAKRRQNHMAKSDFLSCIPSYMPFEARKRSTNTGATTVS